MYGKPCKRDWMAKVIFLIQMLLTSCGRCNCIFWDIRLKILRLPNINMLFQRVLTRFFKSELFSCLPKVDQVTTVMQRAYCLIFVESNIGSCINFNNMTVQRNSSYRALCFGNFGFSVPLIILADLLGNTCLLAQVQKVIVCDSWLVNFDLFRLFHVSRFVTLWLSCFGQ